MAQHRGGYVCRNDFLPGGFFEDLCHIIGAGFADQFGEIEVFDMNHRSTGKSGFEVLDGDGMLTCYFLLSGKWLI